MNYPRQTAAPTAAFLAQSRQPNEYAASIIPFVLSVFAVAARLWCRWIKKAGYKVDDFLMIIALLFLTGLTFDALWLLSHGFGKHIQVDGQQAVYFFRLGWFIGEVTYTGVIVFVKSSILALYWRIFKTLNIKWEVRAMGLIVCLWGAAVYICLLQQCYPLRKYWDSTIPGTCKLDEHAYFYSISIPNILIDVMLLTMPIRYILRLQMGKRQKKAFATLFLLGGFVCIASVIRLISVISYDVNSTDYTWVFVNQSIWGVVECNAAIISGCLPCLGPLWPSTWSRKDTPPNGPGPVWTIGSEPRKGISDHLKGLFTDTHSSHVDALQLTSQNPPEGCIKIMDEWTVKTERVSSHDTPNTITT